MCAFVAEKQEDEDDFLFGSYQPSAAASSAGNSRPGSRRSVRCVWCDVFVCMCIHLADLALDAQSGVCVGGWVISYPQGVGVCTYSDLDVTAHSVVSGVMFVCLCVCTSSRPGSCQSLRCVWSSCAYVWCVWSHMCVYIFLSVSLCLFLFVCLSEKGKIINDAYIGGQTLIRFVYIIYMHAYTCMHACMYVH